VQVKMRVIEAFLAEGSPKAIWPAAPATATTTRRASATNRCWRAYFRAEKVLARLSIVSGTHAIVASLDALTRPGQTLLCANGAPYDTLALRDREAPYSLVSRGVVYAEVRARLDRRPTSRARRSGARARRRSYSCSARAATPRGGRSRIDDDRRASSRPCAMRDRGARRRRQLLRRTGRRSRTARSRSRRLAIGSLIKNLGGGIAPTGGYVAGRADLDRSHRDASSSRPASGRASGRRWDSDARCCKGYSMRRSSSAKRCAARFRGCAVRCARLRGRSAAGERAPTSFRRSGLGTRAVDRLRARPAAALPINARFRAQPGPRARLPSPGDHVERRVRQRSTIDLSCDAPLRAPYEVYLQGGITAEHVALGTVIAATEVMRTK
jgi:cystathionine beta-lyase family protein involved in aluminum resistance